jgi:GNAT superfamily N-acetyltransferase
MIELNKDQIKNLLPTYTGQTPLELQFALELQYAYNDENPFGKPYCAPVYADNTQSPNILYIGTGWVWLSGNAAYEKSDNDFRDFLLNQFDFINGDDKRIFLQLCSPGWESKIEKLFNGYMKDKIIRYNYRLNKESYSKHTGWQKSIPAGLEMRYFDVNSGDFLDKHNNGRGFWFLESKRFGFALVKDSEIISDCISVYYEKEAYNSETARVVEIGIETKAEYRRQGLAFLSCLAFIDYCLSHNYEPNWGCWNYKPESQALAKKLGFEEISQRNVIILAK